MADDALDLRRAGLERALQRVDIVVDVVNRELGVAPAVEVDDLAVLGLAHAHVMHVANDAASGRLLAPRDRHGSDALRRSLAAGHVLRLQRLDMGLDLDAVSEFGFDRVLERVGGFMRRAESMPAIDSEISGHPPLATQSVHRDMAHELRDKRSVS